MFKIKKDLTKFLILATGDGWQLAPKESEKVIYALNDFVYYEKYRIMPDVLFMLDVLNEKPQVISGLQNLGDTISRINKIGVPFIAPYKYEEIPLSEAFPLKECVKEFGLPYFTNTICYMIAYALIKGAKEIELFGVNQAGSHEYMEEKGGVEYWIGIAVGRGVKVTINGKDSQLLRHKGRYDRGGLMYGYLASFDEVMRQEEQFGKPIILKLLSPVKPYSKVVRNVN